MAGSRLRADPLYQGLTRPAMIFGVTYNFFLINVMSITIAFINTRDFFVVLVIAPAIHALGYYICLREPRFLELIALRLGKCQKCKNRLFHGFTNSYDAF
jgi:type IV secretion system protein VirB3